ncbi:peptidase A2 domain-containing protein [Trichonephila clavipes]|nr:peptidase A2 domain-containing protein [Trichonephila clavipes]
MKIGMPVCHDACLDYQTTTVVVLFDNVRGRYRLPDSLQMRTCRESRLTTENNLPPIIFCPRQSFSTPHTRKLFIAICACVSSSTTATPRIHSDFILPWQRPSESSYRTMRIKATNRRVIATRNSEAVNRRRARRQEAIRTPQDNEYACSFAQRSERAYVGTFFSAATDLSANYLGIHHANNHRESRRSRRQNPRRNLVVVGIRKFQGPRNAFHPAAIKKRIQRGVITTTFSQPHISRRLFIKDKSSTVAFFIDTGSDVSVLPASISEKRKGNSIQQLSVANTSPINVYDSS